MHQILSPIVFPKKEIANYKELYFRGEKYFAINRNIEVHETGILATNTYYNSFSIEKWKKYTNIENLYLKLVCKGKFQITIVNTMLVFDDVIEKVLEVKYYDIKDFESITINLSCYKELKGVLSYKIEAISKVSIVDGGYYTEDKFDIPRLGLVICTFKREKYIESFVCNFLNYKSKQQLKVFIIDNGKSLIFDNLPTEIKIIPNKNYGGAGGFSRGMLEVKKYNENNKDKLNYIILMDDDILVDFAIFDKLIAFLALLKEEYSNYFFAGTMCSLDDKKLQYERYGFWCGNGFRQISPGYDLTNLKCILKNEIIENVEFGTAGWWFSCFSTNLLGCNNFPFPCFFRGDDVEYTIRNGFNIITLNGINVWHEPFYKKYSIVSEDYYLLRNTLVINTLYLNWLRPKDNIKYLFKRFAKSIIKYDYDSAKLIIKALKDYEKGPSFFEKTDPERLNNDLSKYNHKLISIDKLIKYYSYKDIIDCICNENDISKWHKIFRLLTCNGNLLPGSGVGFSFVGYGARAINFYRKNRVLNYDPFTYSGYYTNKNLQKTFKLTIIFIKESIIYYWKFNKIKKDYQCNFHKLQTESFWYKYLNLEEKNE